MARRGIGHVHQFRFVRWRHDNHVGQGRQIGDVERACVRAAICADQAGAINGKANRQVLDSDIVHHLIIGALQEGRINSAERPHSLRRQTSGEGHAMLLGNADVKAAVGMRLRKFIDAGARGHGRGDGANGRVGISQLGKRFAEHILVRRRAAAGALVLLAGNDVEFDDAMIFVRSRFGRGIALAFLRDDMDEHGAFRIVTDIFEDRDQLFQIVAINRADIIEAELFEQGAAHRHAAGIFLRLGRRIVDTARQPTGKLARETAQPKIFAGGYQTRKISGKATYRRGNRHVVVVEYDDQPVARRLGVVHSFIGHARAHRAVADNRDCLAGFARHLVGDRKSESSRNRCRAVRGTERVIFAFATLGETRESAACPQRADPFAAAGEDLVGITLVADIPDQAVVRRVEHIMDRGGQFDNAKPGPQMPARHRNG